MRILRFSSSQTDVQNYMYRLRVFFQLARFFQFLYIFIIFLGDITQKGYEKKKIRLLAPYTKEAHESEFFVLFVFVFLFYC